jgi:hypothetical protein
MGSISLTRDAAFEPEAVKAMTEAYDSVLLKINGNGTPAVREMVAKRIVELAAAGECSPKRLRDKVLLHIPA